MAIYEWQMQTIKRSEGRSSVAAAAYRAGAKITDERTGLIHNFKRKKGIDYSAMVGWTGSRSELWNAVEAAEKRKDSRLAREIVVAIPCELSKEIREAMIVEYSQALRDRWGVALDVNIHLPHGKGADTRNVHAHIMLTSRTVADDKLGDKTRHLDLSTTSDAEISWARKAWEDHANAALKAMQSEARIDCRSLKDRGFDREARVHLGPAQTAMERRGVATVGGTHNHQVDVIENDRLALARLEREDKAAKRREREIIIELQGLADEKIIKARRKLPALEKAWAAGEPVRRFYTLEDFIDTDYSLKALAYRKGEVRAYEQKLAQHRQQHRLACWWADKGFLDHPLFFGEARSRYLSIQKRLAEHEGIALHIEQEREEQAITLAPTIQHNQALEDARFPEAHKLYVIACNWLDEVQTLAGNLTSAERAAKTQSMMGKNSDPSPLPERPSRPKAEKVLKMVPKPLR